MNGKRLTDEAFLARYENMAMEIKLLHEQNAELVEALEEIDEYFETLFQVGNLISDAEIHLRGLVKVALGKVGE